MVKIFLIYYLTAYYTPDGAYPSITTILGKTANNVWLQKWIEKVGEEEALDFST